jgi:superfamily I DNA and RNA helicase
VDKDHGHEKNLPLIQDRTLTLSTVASAKGYDAAIVLLLGADLFTNDARGRASFYVAATRAKVKLFISGTQPNHGAASLLQEIL